MKGIIQAREATKNEDITLYYFGDIMDTIYKSQKINMAQLVKWHSLKNKKINDIAFILRGHHNNLQAREIYKYMDENALYKLQIYDILELYRIRNEKIK